MHFATVIVCLVLCSSMGSVGWANSRSPESRDPEFHNRFADLGL